MSLLNKHLIVKKLRSWHRDLGFLMVGICGGFTTFSSFANENLMLLHNGLMLSILLYTGLSILLGFTAVYLGYVTSNLL